MAIGMIVLIIAAVLVLFGIGQRVLDRMHLTDRQAIGWMALILIGGFLPNISLGEALEINIGGFLVPLALSVYLFAKADTWGEKGRAVLSAVVCAVAVRSIGVWFPNEPEAMPFDVNYLYGIGAGVLSCFLGRSRRAAFVGGAMGVILADIVQWITNKVNSIDQMLVLGGAGAFDITVIAAFTAVLLREFIGETQERMTRKTGRPQRKIENGEIEPAVLGAHKEDATDDLPPEGYPEDEKLFADKREDGQDD